MAGGGGAENMTQMDVTAGGGAGRVEPVLPGLQGAGVRPGARITPQPPPTPKRVQADGDGQAPQQRSGGPSARPSPPTGPGSDINMKEIAALQSALLRGPDALARQRDLGEMHRRIVELFQTLNQGLSEQQLRKAAEDRSALIARIDRMEKAVNAMEGAVRIEMAPMMRGMLDEALDSHHARQRHVGNTSFWASCTLGVGLALGVFFASDIQSISGSLFAALEQVFTGKSAQ